MAENLSVFQTEIQELEAKLEAKKREMAAAGTETPEKHIFKTVLHEHSGHEASPQTSESQTAPQPSASVSDAPISAADSETIDGLISHAFTKGIASAVTEAKKMNIPFLIDMLHDRLADEYYQKLLEARELNQE